MDKARKETDKRLAKMESELTKIYQKSAKNVYAKWNKYMAKAAEELKPLQNKYEQAKLSGNKDLIKETGKKLERAKREITIQSHQYQKMLDETLRRLSLVNQTAVAYLNKQIPDIYTLNYNSISDDAFKVGVNFGLIDTHTVKRLVSDENIKLPYKKINISKDIRWNTKQLNSAVLQGILQGDSIQKIVERIFPIVNNNKNAAVRNARTMVTGAECAGRNDSYKELESRGIVLKKVWIATPDSRTRDSHLKLDGEEVNVNEEFSNGCMYPGDPNGDPSEVYNCRCSIRTHIIGFRNDDGSISKIDFEREETLHDKQMEEEKERREIKNM
jgi:SPP1 gp7 family putative phage head morphogenesis protein